MPKTPQILPFPANIPEPPTELAEAGSQLWRTVMERYVIEGTPAEAGRVLMPRPLIRNNSAFSDELMQQFDRAVGLRVQRERLKDELITVEKRLQVLMRESFGEHWWFGCTSVADNALDTPLHHPIGGGTQSDLDWPQWQRDREVVVAAHTEWKQRKAS
jgi:hypothetical protein